MLAIFLGLTLAAVREMREDCRSQNLLTDSGDRLLTDFGGRLLLDQQCEVVAGDLRVPLPAWTQVIRKALL
jgi:hypothetical protein